MSEDRAPYIVSGYEHAACTRVGNTVSLFNPPGGYILVRVPDDWPLSGGVEVTVRLKQWRHIIYPRSSHPELIQARIDVLETELADLRSRLNEAP